MFAFQVFLALLAALLCYSAIMAVVRSDKVKKSIKNYIEDNKDNVTKGAKACVLWIRNFIVLSCFVVCWGIGLFLLGHFTEIYEFSPPLAGLVYALYIWLFLRFFFKVKKGLNRKIDTVNTITFLYELVKQTDDKDLHDRLKALSSHPDWQNVLKKEEGEWHFYTNPYQEPYDYVFFNEHHSKDDILSILQYAKDKEENKER